MNHFLGNKIHLREHVLSDREAYTDWQCNPEVGEFVDWLPKSEEESFLSLQDAIDQQSAKDRVRYFLAIVRREDNEMMGDVGITRLEDGSGDMGWFIRRKYWGMGYASEAVGLMIIVAFEEIGLTKIRASCRKDNTRSVRIMEKCGFHLVNKKDNRLYYVLESGDLK